MTKKPTNKLLALTGRRYSGKSTVAELLCEMDNRFVRRSFGDIIKQEFSQKAGIDLVRLNTVGVKDLYRQAIFDFDKEVKKSDPYYFAKKLFAQIPAGEFTVIDDLRFIEELDLCLKRDAIVFKVHASESNRKMRGWRSSEIDCHYSETELDYPGYFFWQVTGGKFDEKGRIVSYGRGGVIFNTRNDDDHQYLKSQIFEIIKRYFQPLVCVINQNA